MNRSLRLMLGLAAAASLGMAAQAHADPAGVKVGVLTCNVSSGWGLIFGSSRELNCTFSADSKHFENYVGKISKFGVDIGYEHAAIMAWGVFAPSADVKPGSLAGDYAGATVSASAIVGGGANALVGGSDQHFQLQPLSIEGNVGLNVAAGVANITLVYKPD